MQSSMPAAHYRATQADQINRHAQMGAYQSGLMTLGIIRDRDRIYGTIVTRRLRAMGIRDKPTAPASPWQNGFAERLIGSIRRECVDHFVVLGEAHLRRILRAYARYYNDIRTHRSLDKDAPVSRPVQRTGAISSHAILGGLHHHYVRI
jgi:transposase InsO family protein